MLLGVTEARSRVGQVQQQANPTDPGSLKQFESAQAQMSSALSRLLVVAERYPELKSDQNFRELQAELAGTENRITVARKRYIDSINAYNVLVREFPVNLTAKVMGYAPKPQFSVENEAAISKPPEQRQSLALNILGDNQQRLAGLHDLLKNGNQILHVRDLLVDHQDVGVFQNGFLTLGVGHEVAERKPLSKRIPSVSSRCRPKVLDSSTVITPSLPTFSIA